MSEVRQRSMQEIRRLVREDHDRFNDLHDAWQEMTADEQATLVAVAQAMVATETVRVLSEVTPESRKA